MIIMKRHREELHILPVTIQLIRGKNSNLKPDVCSEMKLLISQGHKIVKQTANEKHLPVWGHVLRHGQEETVGALQLRLLPK